MAHVSRFSCIFNWFCNHPLSTSIWLQHAGHREGRICPRCISFKFLLIDQTRDLIFFYLSIAWSLACLNRQWLKSYSGCYRILITELGSPWQGGWHSFPNLGRPWRAFPGYMVGVLMLPLSILLGNIFFFFFFDVSLASGVSSYFLISFLHFFQFHSSSVLYVFVLDWNIGSSFYMFWVLALSLIYPSFGRLLVYTDVKLTIWSFTKQIWINLLSCICIGVGL